MQQPLAAYACPRMASACPSAFLLYMITFLVGTGSGSHVALKPFFSRSKRKTRQLNGGAACSGRRTNGLASSQSVVQRMSRACLHAPQIQSFVQVRVPFHGARIKETKRMFLWRAWQTAEHTQSTSRKQQASHREC